jgi:hypothetical protein
MYEKTYSSPSRGAVFAHVRSNNRGWLQNADKTGSSEKEEQSRGGLAETTSARWKMTNSSRDREVNAWE